MWPVRRFTMPCRRVANVLAKELTMKNKKKLTAKQKQAWERYYQELKAWQEREPSGHIPSNYGQEQWLEEKPTPPGQIQ